jgi:hypothetical protein
MPALTSEQRATLEARLAQAETALHELTIGATAVTVSYEGESATFHQTSEGKLRRYIDELRARLGLVCMARRPGVSA